MTKQRSLFALFPLLMLAGACSSPSTVPRSRTDVADQASSAQPAHTQKAATATPSFDFYLLTLSWSPEYCKTHASAAECSSHPAFVLHGLWPEEADGTYRTKCSSAPGPANPALYKDIYPDVSLLKHEWSTHGTCSGLGPDAFFTAARKAFHSVVVPPKLAQLSSGVSMKPVDILNLFPTSNPGLQRADLLLSCTNNALTAVEVCLDKSLHPIACGPIKSCRASSVTVTAP